MNARRFLPHDFSPPLRVVTPEFTLVTLAPVHNELDYDAWSTSIPELIGIFGPQNRWPENVSGLSENLKDLERHAGFQARTECTYTVLSPDESICLGCVYLRSREVADYDCRVDFWVRTSLRERLEPVLYKFLKKWLRENWPFEFVAFPGREISWDEWAKNQF